MQQPRHDSSKMGLSSHCGHLCELCLGHQAHGPIYNFGSNHDWDHLKIGCGWYGQQQHILIVVFDSWDLEVDLPEPELRDGRTPCSLTQALDLQHNIPTKLGTYAGDLSTQINQCGHFLPIHYHWALLECPTK